MQGRIDDSDVIQQTCLSVHKQFTGFGGSDPAEFVAWLRLIHERNIQNAVRDHMAVQKRSVDRFVAVKQDDLVGHETTPSQIVVREEQSAQLLNALSSLPEEEQDVFRLRYYENYSVQQIAEALGLTPDAVAWRMKKGMKAMKKHLGDGAGFTRAVALDSGQG